MKKIKALFYVLAISALFILMSGCSHSKKETGEIADSDEVDADIYDSDGSDSEPDDEDEEIEDDDSGDTVTDADTSQCQTIDGIMWSSHSEDPMNWYDAVKYCKKLDECGYSDWYLPTIDELRSLVTGCQHIETGGDCAVTENCLSFEDCWSHACNCEPYEYDPCSKLGECESEIMLWSSSTQSDFPDYAWYISFFYGDVYNTYKMNDAYSYAVYYAQCARSENGSSGKEDEDDEDEKKEDFCYFYECRDGDSYCGYFVDLELNWKKYETCMFSECNDYSGKCRCKNDGDLVCYDDAFRICSEHEWQIAEICKSGCHSSNKDCIPWEDPETKLMWSMKSLDSLRWNSAVSYCEDLEEGGYSDWRLPTIDELRTLIRNCANTEPDGDCRVTDDGCLKESCANYFCGCDYRGGNNGAYYSKMGDDGGIYLWSSSTQSDEADHAWTVCFDQGRVLAYDKDYKYNEYPARCVRSDHRIQPCTGLPENAKWNEFSSIPQTLEGESWGPDTTGVYNETPSGTECRFICNPGYKWNGSECKLSDISAISECSPESPTPCRDLTSDMIWSAKSGGMKWQDAVDYCNNLTQGGFSDWRLPDIDELRTLIQNCSNTEPDGQCKASENKEKLSESASYPDGACYCSSTKTDGYYSKFGDDDKVTLWSSSAVSDYADGNYAWSVAFDHGKVDYSKSKDSLADLRCVRREKRDRLCRNLPENAVWNGAASITQTWNDGIWQPSDTGVCSEIPSETECSFTCNPGYGCDGSKCTLTDIDAISECSSESPTPCKDSLNGMIWSARSGKIKWSEAVDYCDNLTEGGISRWHLPDIDELRTLIQNCDGTSTGGGCGVTGGCAAQDDCWTENVCRSCASDSSGKYSKFGENVELWSYSAVSKNSCCAWEANFGSGSIELYNKDESKYIRCVSSDRRRRFCTDLPENTSWNIFASITQTWNGESWVPATTGVYSETPSETECRFICNPGYTREGSECKLSDINLISECGPESPTPCRDRSKGLMWSAKSLDLDWSPAVDYCENLVEGGFTDWRLPDIGELRTLIQNCQGTVAGGECAVTAECLSSSCLNSSCRSCSSDLSGKYSKFSETDNLWSHSVADMGSADSQLAYIVNFSNGVVTSVDKIAQNNFFPLVISVRCVR
ncbi:DUF1566 domain-containing protein [bacterium]|nr:DUF1566 domain-containing protein [bacterium]